MRMRSS